MNKFQRDYSMNRVDQILKTKLDILKEKMVKQPIILTAEQKAKAFRDGKFKINKDLTKINSYTDVEDIITFNDEKPEVIQSGYEKKIDELRQKAQEVKDEIMLGDADIALKLIQKFAAS